MVQLRAGTVLQKKFWQVYLDSLVLIPVSGFRFTVYCLLPTVFLRRLHLSQRLFAQLLHQLSEAWKIQ